MAFFSLNFNQNSPTFWQNYRTKLDPTLLDVNVVIVAKHYPTLLDETSHRCKLVLNLFWKRGVKTQTKKQL